MVNKMPLKTLAMMSGQSTSRCNDDTSIVDDDITQNSQLVIIGQLRGIVD